MTNPVLPDGSSFFTASFPLPTDHWLYAPLCAQWDHDRDCTADRPHPILTHHQRDAVIAGVRYAIRAATMNGAEKDFDPDALVQNAVVALCGPYSALSRLPNYMQTAPEADTSGEAKRPGYGHALGCAFNGMDCLECSCGMPNLPTPGDEGRE